MLDKCKRVFSECVSCYRKWNQHLGVVKRHLIFIDTSSMLVELKSERCTFIKIEWEINLIVQAHTQEYLEKVNLYQF